MNKLRGVAAGVVVAIVVTSTAQAEGSDISGARLLASWKDDDRGTRMIAEVIASAFASGFSWGDHVAGGRSYCASPGLKGGQIMSAFEGFLRDNPKMANEPYGAAMAGTLRRAFPCGDKS